MDLDKLITELQVDEGWRPFLYDDANGNKVTPGYRLEGHPTIGWGFAFDVSPLTMSEAIPILENRASQKWVEVQELLPWAAVLPEDIQRALSNMAYNMGTETLATFTTFLSLLQAGKYSEAADDLKTTLWAKQTGNRALRIIALIKGAGIT